MPVNTTVMTMICDGKCQNTYVYKEVEGTVYLFPFEFHSIIFTLFCELI